MLDRRLKAPKGRLASGAPTPVQSFSSNLFGNGGASQQNQQQSGFGGINGTAFSASQSFPPATPISFNSFAPPQSSSFTFGAQTPSNPFANLGSNTTSNGLNGGMFGAQTNGISATQNDGDTMMESPKKTFNGFNAGNSAAPSSSPFTFGQSAQSGPPSSGFGASTTSQAPTPSFGFGQSQATAEPNNTFGVFGGQKAEEPKPQKSLFGESTTTSQPAPSFFGQASTTTSSSSNSLFGQPAPAPAASSKLFGQQQATTSAPSSNLFDQAAPTPQPSSTPGPFGSLFGKSSSSPKPASETRSSSEAPKPALNFASSTTQPPFSFSTGPVTTSQHTSSLFTSKFASSTPSPSAPASSAAVFSFGQPAATPKQSESDAQPTGDTNVMSTDTATPQPNLFGFKPNVSSASSGTGGLFGAPKTNDSNDASGGGLFGRVSLPQEPSLKAAEPVSTTAPSQEQMSSTPVASGTNTNSLFGNISRPDEPPKPQGTPAPLYPTKQAPIPGFGGFQPRASTQRPALAPSASPFGNPFSGLSNTVSSAKSQEASRGFTPVQQAASTSHDDRAESAESTAKQQPLHSLEATPVPAARPSTSFATPAASQKAPAVPQTAPAASRSSAPTSKTRMRSVGASTTPDFFEGDEGKEHDRLCRLRNLNAHFQKEVAKLNPESQDFAMTVRHYIAQREAIGLSLGMYQRTKAGVKRKTDTSASEDAQNAVKRARIGPSLSEPASAAGPQATTSSNLAPQQPNTTMKIQSTFQPGNSRLASPSSTSSLFKSMSASTPATPAASASETKASTGLFNPFASAQAPSTRAPATETSSSSTNLVQPQIPSTTPTKSPPKKPAFEMPKFGGSSGINFMDAFAKGSAKSAADMEAEAKRKRKAEDFDSDEDDESEWERNYEEEQRAKRNKIEAVAKAGMSGFQPIFGSREASANTKETSATAKNFFNLANNKSSSDEPATEQTPPASTPSGFTGFGPTSVFGKSAEQPVSIRDEDGESSRGSEQSGSREETSNQGSEEDDAHDEDYEQDESDAEDDQEEEDEEQEAEDNSDDEDIQAAMSRPKPRQPESKGGLFGRVEPNPDLHNSDGTRKTGSLTADKPNGVTSDAFESTATPNPPKTQPAANNSFKPFVPNGIPKSTPTAPTHSPFTPANGSLSTSTDPFAPAGSVFGSAKKPDAKNGSTTEKTNGGSFFFAPKSNAPTSAPSQSVLFGGNNSLGSGAIPGEGLFGSRPSTPNNAETSGGSIFGNLGKGINFSGSQGDNTWKAGTPIRFGTPDKNGPIVNVTAATPPAKDDSSKPFGNLFGSSKPNTNSLGGVGFNFGGSSALTASPLLTPSVMSSAVSSRATSPGATDTESVNTDTAEDAPNDPQTSLMSSRPGEENEEVLFEGRTKALKYVNEQEAKEKKLNEGKAGYATLGVGQLRVLKHKDTDKARILLRAEPGSNIVINTALNAAMAYKPTPTKGSGAVKFGIPTAKGIEQWVVKIKTTAMAEELANILEANKGEIGQS